MDSLICSCAKWVLNFPDVTNPEVKANFHRQLAFSGTIAALRIGTLVGGIYCVKKIALDGPHSIVSTTMLLALGILSGQVFRNAGELLHLQCKGELVHLSGRSHWRQISDAINMCITYNPFFPDVTDADVRDHLSKQRYFSMATGVIGVAAFCGTVKGLQLVLSTNSLSNPMAAAGILLSLVSIEIAAGARESLYKQGRGVITHRANSGPCTQVAYSVCRVVCESLHHWFPSKFS